MGDQHEFEVLVVDDEEEHRRNYSRWLQRVNIKVLTANDGLNALDLLRLPGEDSLPDCIILRRFTINDGHSVKLNEGRSSV